MGSQSFQDGKKASRRLGGPRRPILDGPCPKTKLQDGPKLENL
ncbi:hypothetical protein COLO4_34900 [Corchorus olitorius]|uniref:Uncharacterized protein n=1 Tax=Corchorus olitorius TaxID=93759 RepID=A0A1R3GJ22_9ROSI|nr:hypothetical protein COLO4_34900 [Corchorus olitorius]